MQLLTGPGETRPLHGSVGLLPEWPWGLRMPRHPQRVTDSVTVRCSLQLQSRVVHLPLFSALDLYLTQVIIFEGVWLEACCFTRKAFEYSRFQEFQGLRKVKAAAPDLSDTSRSRGLHMMWMTEAVSRQPKGMLETMKRSQ